MVLEVVSNAMSSKEVTLRIIVMTIEIENQGNISPDVGYSVCFVRRFRGGAIVSWNCKEGRKDSKQEGRRRIKKKKIEGTD